MSLYSTEIQQLGLKKEVSRGAAESAPTKWYPTRGKAEFNYGTSHLADDGIRGRASKYAPIQGVNTGDAKVPLILDPQTIGEFLYSLLGSVSSAQQGGSSAYKHTFTPSASIQKPSYTFFMDRGLNVMKYNLGVVKKLAFKGGVDNLIDVDADILFKSEASGSIGSPSYPTQRYCSFQNVDFKIAGSSNTDVKEWNLNIDNTSRAHRVLALSRDVSDILAPDRLMIDGGFTIFFQNTTERDKFLANTAVALRILCEGAIIASSYKYTVDINIYEAHYKAFPYGEEQGLLAAKVTFDGFYSASDSKECQFDVINTDTAY